MKNAECIYQVECFVTKRQVLRVTIDRFCGKAFERQVLLRVAKMLPTEVERGHVIAVFGKTKMVAPEADANFQDVSVSPRLKSHGRIEPGAVDLVAMVSDCAVEAGGFRRLGPDGDRSTGVAIPLLLDFVFIGIEWHINFRVGES